jgi:hypothetical protein
MAKPQSIRLHAWIKLVQTSTQTRTHSRTHARTHARTHTLEQASQTSGRSKPCTQGPFPVLCDGASASLRESAPPGPSPMNHQFEHPNFTPSSMNHQFQHPKLTPKAHTQTCSDGDEESCRLSCGPHSVWEGTSCACDPDWTGPSCSHHILSETVYLPKVDPAVAGHR